MTKDDTVEKIDDLPLSKTRKTMLYYFGFLFLVLVIFLLLSIFEVYPFEVYIRKYAPLGITDGKNKSPYTPI